MNAWTRSFIVLAVLALAALVLWKVTPGTRGGHTAAPSVIGVHKTGAAASHAGTSDGATPQDGETAADGADPSLKGGEGVGAKLSTTLRRGKGAIFGSVRAFGSDRPVAGAAITMELDQTPDEDLLVGEHPRWQTVSDEAGAFDFVNVPDDANFSLLAVKDDLAGLGQAYVDNGESGGPVAIVVQNAGTIRGRTVDASGQPVANAEITAKVVRTGEIEASYNSFKTVSKLLRAVSDAQGAFTLTKLPGDHWRVYAKAEGYALHESEPVTAGGPDLEITLSRGATAKCAVRIADTGAPAPGISVRIEGSALYGNTQEKIADDAGQVVFDGLADDDYTLSIRDPKYVVTGQQVQFTVKGEAAVEGLQLTVALGGIVSGHVYEAATREPVKGAEIKIDDSGGVRTGRSGADGAYRLEGISPGAQEVILAAKGYVRDEHLFRPVSVRLGAENSGVDFLVKRGVSVRGRVVDTNKRAIAHAQVNVQSRASRAYDEYSTLTDDDGAFDVAGITPKVPVVIRAQKSGFAQDSAEPISVGEDGLNDVVITLGPGGSISGVVNYVSGKPARDMYVSAALENAKESEPPAGANAGEDGRFTIAGLPAGNYGLRLNGGPGANEALATVTLSAGQQVTGIALVAEEERVAGALSISGRVTNSKGDGVARVNVYANRDSSPDDRSARSFGTAITGKDGRYAITGLAEGDHEVSLNSQNYASSDPITATAGSTNANFVLKDLGSIEGLVVDAVTGRPIANFDIGLGEGMKGIGAPERDLVPGGGNLTPFSSPDGKFRVERVQPGDVGVRAYASGYAPGAQLVRGVRSGETSTGVTIRLSAGGIIEGYVRNRAGEPISGAQIAAGTDLEGHGDGGSTPVITTSDADGKFRLDSLVLEPLELVARHEDYIESKTTITPKAGVVTSVDLVLGHGGTITGVVRKNGKPAAGLDVEASNDEEGSSSASTDESGAYAIANVPPGEVHIEVSVESSRGGALRLSKTAHVIADRNVVVDFDFSGGTATVEGKITSGGQPVRHARVTALPIEMESGTTVTADVDAETGEDGSYKVEGVPVGKINLLVTLERDAANEPEDSALPPSETRAFSVQTTAGQTAHRDIDIGGGSAVVGAVTGLAEGERAVALVMRGEVALTEPNVVSSIYGERRSGTAGSTVSKPDGTFRVSGLEPGRYTVVAVAMNPSTGPADEHPRYTSNSVTVPDSGEVRVDLRIP